MLLLSGFPSSASVHRDHLVPHRPGCQRAQAPSLAFRSRLSPSHLRLPAQHWQRKDDLLKHRRKRHRTSCYQGSGADTDTAVENLVIIGSGPAGYTSAIYAARANLNPLVFEGYQVGGVRGGQLMTTTEVENFPGFPEGITGPDLMDKMRQQAERWGAELLTEDVDEVDLSVRPFRVKTSETEVRAHSIVIATGATAKKLGIPSEERFWSAGISACAICDGASYNFRNQELAVAGGGDTAAEEAVYLTKYASKVHMLVRGARMRASGAMQNRVLKHPKIEVHFNTAVDDAYPDGKGAMAGIHVKNTESGEGRQLPIKGLFYGIGHQPNSRIVQGQIELDDKGYVVVHDGVQTSVEGVYAAGDLHDTEWRQAVTAAGSGCMAALAAERYLTANDLLHTVKRQQQAAPEQQPKQQAADTSGSEEDSFDINQNTHKGQFALRRLYHESERLVVVLYTAPSCGPCRTLKPIFNKVVEEYSGKVHLVEVDVEQDQEIAQAGGVTSTPTVQIFKAKERLEHLPGVKMKSEYRKLIEQGLQDQLQPNSTE